MEVGCSTHQARRIVKVGSFTLASWKCGFADAVELDAEAIGFEHTSKRFSMRLP
jgi:hypothetical protein